MEEKNEKVDLFEKVTLKFAAGLLGEPFEAKDGITYRVVKIPNKSPEDKSPWASFVTKANQVHKDKFGKGMWLQLPANGTTTVVKPSISGKDETGKDIYVNNKTVVPNRELKAMVEFYKERSPRYLVEEPNPIPTNPLEDKRDSLLARLSEKPVKQKRSTLNKSKKNLIGLE